MANNAFYDSVTHAVKLDEYPTVQIKAPVQGGAKNHRVSIRSSDGEPIDIEDPFGNLEWKYAIEDGPWMMLGIGSWAGLREGDIIKLPPQSIGRFQIFILGICIRSDDGTGLLGFWGDESWEDNDGEDEQTYGPEEERDPFELDEGGERDIG